MEARSIPPEHIPYTVDYQNVRPLLMPNGQFVDVYEIHYTGPSGTPDYVTVPKAQYTAANVDNAIQEQLRHVEDVHQLGPQPHPDNLAPGH